MCKPGIAAKLLILIVSFTLNDVFLDATPIFYDDMNHTKSKAVVPYNLYIV